MRFTLIVALVAALAAAGCKSSEPAKGSTGSAGSSGSAAPDPGSAAVAPVDAAGSVVETVACKPVTITLAKVGHTVKRDTETRVTKETMEATLKSLADACKSGVTVTAANDIDYQTVIDAMDVAKQVGFTAIALASPGDDKYPRPADKPPIPPGGPIDQAPIVIVTKTDVSIAFGKGERLAIGTVDSVDDKALDEAMQKVPRPATGDLALIVQADAKTSAKLINQIILAGKRAGFHDVLFAIKNR